MIKMTMPIETESEKWLDFAKIIALCVGPYFLIKSWIDKYFKDKADQREAAFKVLINEQIDNRVVPDIKRLTESIDRLNEAIHDLKLKSTK